MVFSYTEKDEEATGGPRKAPELVFMGLGKMHSELKTRSFLGLVWIMGTAPVISASLQVAFPKPLLSPK